MQPVHLRHLERGTNEAIQGRDYKGSITGHGRYIQLYSVFYTICEDKVIVTDVLYTASDIEARLRGV